MQAAGRSGSEVDYPDMTALLVKFSTKTNFKKIYIRLDRDSIPTASRSLMLIQRDHVSFKRNVEINGHYLTASQIIGYSYRHVIKIKVRVYT